MNLILSWAILSFAVWLTAEVLPGFHVKSFGSAILVAALFGVLNFFLGWLFSWRSSPGGSSTRSS